MVRTPIPSVYRGRFAPSPTGQLHLGSLVAALASYLDARSAQGTWLIRIEDIDPPREMPGAAQHILKTLETLELVSDEPTVWQHDRYERYEAIMASLKAQGLVYPCACSRKEIAQAALAKGLDPHVYPGTCRDGLHNREARAWRFRTHATPITLVDRWMGPYTQNVETAVGDFILKRADGLWAYQLAVVTDDLDSGITHIVRGADILDNTPRQIALIEALKGHQPTYLHLPLVLNADGTKLSKQAGAQPLNPDDLKGELERAFVHLGFPRIGADHLSAFYRVATDLWKERFWEA